MSDTRNVISTGFCAVLVSLVFTEGPVLAQDDPIIPEQERQQVLTDDLIGMPVYGQNVETGEREEIGDIKSLLLNENNRITGVVVSFGGFLGMGAKSVAIDWDALEVQQSGLTAFTATVDMTRAQIEEAPAFKTLARKEAERRSEEQMRQQQEQQQQGTGIPRTGTGTTPE